ncbi:MAG: type II toxin-antitoxin system VapC family toxin [Pseudanabaena sp.]|jgi:hypothetical protein
MILCNAGVLICLGEHTQPQHNVYKNAVMRLEKPFITTWSCLTEAMYLALHRGVWQMQNQLAEILLKKMLIVHEIPDSDYSRLFALMEQYRDCPMD